MFPFPSGPGGELVSEGCVSEHRSPELKGFEGWWRGKRPGIFGPSLS